MSKELEEYKYSNLELLREIWFNVPEGSQKIHQKHFDLILSKLNELQSIKEANPSEALEWLNYMESICKEFLARKELYMQLNFTTKQAVEILKEINTIKQALLKAQEPKQYLKWEDLEFDEDGQETLVLLNDTKYRMYYYKGYDECINLFTEDEISVIHIFDGCSPQDKQFFNDLHLERVEE